jgi:aminoglycoside phosphotransferase (APT) family kinase protein
MWVDSSNYDLLSLKDTIMPTVRYENMSATYEDETAKVLKELHDIDLEKHLMEMLKSEYENNGPLAQR